MGFSGGSSNVTKAHQHDSSVTQDGGALAANATQFGLTNGSLLYSDGTNIQELGVGASGEVLGTATGTTPTWQASGGAGGAWEQVFTDTLTGDSNDWENTFTGIDQDDYAMFCLQINAGFDLDSNILMRLHDSGGALTTGWYSDGLKIFHGAVSYLDENSLGYSTISQAGNRKNMIVTVWITMGNSGFTGAGGAAENQRFSWWSTAGVLDAYSSQSGSCTTNPITSFDGVTLYANAVSGANVFETGSKATLWKIL